MLDEYLIYEMMIIGIQVVFALFVCIARKFIPGKYHPGVILLANIIYLFMSNWSRALLPLFLMITIIWMGARVLFEMKGNDRMRKNVFIVVVVMVLGSLICLNYSPFLLKNYNLIQKLTGRSIIHYEDSDLYIKVTMMSVGMGFYTLRALGYVIDVYRGGRAEKNIITYAAFISFFPLIANSPIERPQNLMNQIDGEGRSCSLKSIAKGVILILWATFVGKVLLIRLNSQVLPIFRDYQEYVGTPLVVAAVLNPLAMYVTWLYYSLHALGLGKIMGFQLTEDFRGPFFSRNMREFWKRYYLSVTTWFGKYLYIPLKGNSRTPERKMFSLFITALVGGLWLSGWWNGVIGGGLACLFLVFEMWIDRRRKLRGKETRDSVSHRILQRLTTFVLISIVCLFFSSALQDGNVVEYLLRMFMKETPSDYLQDSVWFFYILYLIFFLVSFGPWVILFFIVDYLKYRTGLSIDEFLAKQHWSIGVIVSILLMLIIWIWGGPDPRWMIW